MTVRRAVVLTADLLFGSNLRGALISSGYEVAITAEPVALREQLAGEPSPTLLVDLTDEPLERVAQVSALREEGLLAGVAVLAYYSHVEASVRDAALAAGFDLVVPRSRMAREAAELTAGVARS